LDTIDRRHLLERQLAHVLPRVAQADLVEEPRARSASHEAVPVALGHDAPRLVRRLLCLVEREADRRGERPRAHAHVGDPRVALELHAEAEVRARRRHLARAVHAHTRRERTHREAQRLEHREEETVLLEAVAAAARVHELGLDRLELEDDGPTEQHVDVLEGDAAHVRVRDRPQRLEGGRA
jgi:hypothetical protein